MSTLFERRHSKSYEDVRKACEVSNSMVEAAESVGIPYKTFIRIAKTLGVFRPNSGGKGLKKKNTKKIELSDILAGKYPEYQTNKIRIRLLQEGIKEHKCEICSLKEWNGKMIPLELDHIDGNNSNHKLENLRIVCPNCHAQTTTYSLRKSS